MANTVVKPLYINTSTGYHQEADPTSFTIAVPTPSSATDAVNKAYVDAVAAADTYTAGNGISIASNVIAAALGTSGGLAFSSGAIVIALASNPGLSLSASGLSVLLNGSTLTLGASGLSVAGVPLNFNIGASATSNNVTAPNLNTLTAGSSSAADALHTHNAVAGAINLQYTLSNSTTALSLGDPVYLTGTANTVDKADASADAKSRVIGLAGSAIAASGTGAIVYGGFVRGCLSSATVGGDVWLKVGGGLTQTIPTTALARLIRVGVAVNASDLFVQINDQGKL